MTNYYSNGSLGDTLHNLNKDCKELSEKESIKRKGIQVWQARFFFIDMLKALHFCHKVVGVVHKNIKPENIVISRNREAILIDFGLVSLYGHSDEE